MHKALCSPSLWQSNLMKMPTRSEEEEEEEEEEEKGEEKEEEEREIRSHIALMEIGERESKRQKPIQRKSK